MVEITAIPRHVLVVIAETTLLDDSGTQQLERSTNGCRPRHARQQAYSPTAQSIQRQLARLVERNQLYRIATRPDDIATRTLERPDDFRFAQDLSL